MSVDSTGFLFALEVALDPLDALDNGDEIARLLRPIHLLILEDAWGDANATLDIDAAFDLENVHVQKVLDQLGTKIKGVAQTTRDKIASLVGQQAESGWSPAELAQKILEQGEIDVQYRAVMIGRTESALAQSLGSIAAYKESGVVESMEWLIGPESCDECTPLAGKIVKMDEPFADGIYSPPVHPNCTCALAPIISE